MKAISVFMVNGWCGVGGSGECDDFCQNEWNASIKKDDAGKNNFILGLLRIG